MGRDGLLIKAMSRGSITIATRLSGRAKQAVYAQHPSLVLAPLAGKALLLPCTSAGGAAWLAQDRAKEAGRSGRCGVNTTHSANVLGRSTKTNRDQTCL
jgi:hypothetical protein